MDELEAVDEMASDDEPPLDDLAVAARSCINRLVACRRSMGAGRSRCAAAEGDSGSCDERLLKPLSPMDTRPTDGNRFAQGTDDAASADAGACSYVVGDRPRCLPRSSDSSALFFISASSRRFAVSSLSS